MTGPHARRCDGTVNPDGQTHGIVGFEVSSDEVVSAESGSDVSVALGDDHVAIVEIHRPPNNFFDVDLIRRLADAFEVLGRGPDCRSILLCSEGKHFCAGADFAGGGGRRDSDRDGERERNRDRRSDGHLYDEAIRLFEQPLPVVAVVQGAAIGGGLGLALAADFRVAAPEARFAANFAKLGFHHGFALSARRCRPRWGCNERSTCCTPVAGSVARRHCGSGCAIGSLRSNNCAAWRGTTRPRSPHLPPWRSARSGSRCAADLVDQARAAMVREGAEQDRLVQTDDWREGVAAVTERRPARFTGQ